MAIYRRVFEIKEHVVVAVEADSIEEAQKITDEYINDEKKREELNEKFKEKDLGSLTNYWCCGYENFEEYEKSLSYDADDVFISKPKPIVMYFLGNRNGEYGHDHMRILVHDIDSAIRKLAKMNETYNLSLANRGIVFCLAHKYGDFDKEIWAYKMDSFKEKK